jgi:hypothetical protein
MMLAVVANEAVVGYYTDANDTDGMEITLQ